MGKDLVLVGGGHAHLTVLLNLARYIERGHRVTVIKPSSYQYYAGMGPGMLSGIYRPQEVRFNIRKMVQDRGGAFLENKVTRINPDGRIMVSQSGQEVPYDVVSFNTGSEVPVQPFLPAPRENVLQFLNYRSPKGEKAKKIFDSPQYFKKTGHSLPGGRNS